MAPTYPWGKKPGLSDLLSPRNHDTMHGGARSPVPQSTKKSDAFPASPGPKSQYEEIQEDELIALAAIYGEDFRQAERKQGPWKVSYTFIYKSVHIS